MEKLPYMQFYPADWIQDTQTLTLAAQGAWITILCQLWVSETPGTRTWNRREFKTLLRLVYDEEIEEMVADLSRVGEVLLTDKDENEVETVEQCAWITITSKRIVRDVESLTARQLTNKRYYDSRKTRVRQVSDAIKTVRSQKSESEEELREEEEEEKKCEEEKKHSVPVRKPSPLPDDEWIESLKTNPAYRHIDFVIENGKMDAWLSLVKNRHRTKTRKFVLNWLNKVEPPIPMQPAGLRTLRPTKVAL